MQDSFLETRIRHLENKLKVAEAKAKRNKDLFHELYNTLENRMEETTRQYKEREKELKFILDQRKLLLEKTTNPFYTTDKELRFTEVNKGFCTTFNVTYEDVIGYKADEIFPKDLENKITQSDRSILESGQPGPYEHIIFDIDKEQKEIILIKYPLFDEEELKGILGLSLDLTETCKLESKLKETEEKMTHMLDSFPGIYVEVDLKGNILDITESIKEFTGRNRKNTISTNVREYMRSPEKADSAIAEITEKGYINDFQITLRTIYGDKILYSDRLVKKKDRIIGSFSDITEIINKNHQINKRLRYEKAINECSKLLMSGRKEEETLNECIKILQDTSGCSRVNLIERKGNSGYNRYEACSPETIPGTEEIDYKNRPTWKRYLPQGMTLKGLTEEFPEKDQLKAQSIESIIAIPLFIKEEWYGHLGFEHTTPYQWEDTDINLLETTAHMIESYITRKLNEQKLHDLAYTDSLTGLYNRKSFIEHLQKEIARGNRDNQQKSIFYIDMDNFKEVNDNYGHISGDNVLIEVAQRLRSTIRESDYVYRQGGDEFCVLLPQGESEEVAQRIKEALSKPYILGDRIISNLSPSIGISVYRNEKGPTEVIMDRLIQEADTAMYKAKELAKEGNDVPFIIYRD
ncbi:MAG: diguanylate cyclase [Candidatus Woesearchaeota archaeon]